MATETTPQVNELSWDDIAEAPAQRRRLWKLPGWASLVVLAALVLSGGGYYVFGRSTSSGPVRTDIPYKVARGPLVITITDDGNVESSSNLDVKCEVAGGSTILWLVKDGTPVEEGDEIARLDSSSIEDQVNSQKIAYEKAQAAKIEAEKAFSSAKIGVEEFSQGTYVQQLQDAEGKITVAMENLRSSENSMQHTDRMARKGYVTNLQREAQAFAVEQAKINLASARTAKDVLERFTRERTLVDLETKRDTAEAKMHSEEAAFELEAARLKRLQIQLDKCTLRAPHSGMVVYANEPGGRPGQQGIQIEEGAAVRERQSIIRLPDLAHMQVKVTVHESKVDQLHPGMRARIRIQDRDFQGEISSVANQPEPGNWMSGNVKEYSTIVRIDGDDLKLRPGMTAIVEILVADLKDVISVPVEAVVEQGGKTYCWVKNGLSDERRPVVTGLSSSTMIEIRDGLAVGEDVILNPRAAVPAAREEVKAEDRVDVKGKFGESKGPAPGAAAPGAAGARGGREGGGRPKMSFSDLDKNGDKKLTIDEVPERMQGFFPNIDTNSDGVVDAKEFAAMQARRRAAEQQGGGGGP